MNKERYEALSQEAVITLGMIDEIRMKCLIFKDKIAKERAGKLAAGKKPKPSEKLKRQIGSKMEKFRNSLNKYEQRLHAIHEELSEITNGTVGI